MRSEPKQKEVWIVDLGDYVPNTSTQRGKKPCVIMSLVNDSEFNEKPCKVVHVGPLTTKLKKMDMPTHTLVTKDEGLREDSCFLGEQSHSVFLEQCLHKVSEVSDETFRRLVYCQLRSYLSDDEIQETYEYFKDSAQQSPSSEPM